MVYRASRDGFDAKSFHTKVDFQGKTISFIRTQDGYVFGVFRTFNFNSPRDYKNQEDPSAFIFSLTRRTVHRPKKNLSNASINHSNYLMF